MRHGRPAHRRAWCALVAVILLLAGCTLSSASDPVTAGTVRADLDTRLAEISRAQEQARDLWTRVIDGDVVSCQDGIAVPQPVVLSRRALAAHPQAEAVQEALNAAIRSLRDSAARWDAECAQPRDQVPLGMARDGRASALAAGESLHSAANLLAAW